MSADEHQEEPVTAYVLKLISEWEERGGKLKDLAEKGGFAAASMVSQVKLRTSMVTNFSGPKFAKAFGVTYPELVATAYALQAGERPRQTIEELLAATERAQAALREEIKSTPWQSPPRPEDPAKAAKRARKAERGRALVREGKAAREALAASKRHQDPTAAKRPKRGAA